MILYNKHQYKIIVYKLFMKCYSFPNLYKTESCRSNNGISSLFFVLHHATSLERIQEEFLQPTKSFGV